MITPRAILRVCSRIVAWLAVGLVITVAVSWGLAAWMPQRNWDQRIISCWSDDRLNGTMSIRRYSTIGCERRVWLYALTPPTMRVRYSLQFVSPIESKSGFPASPLGPPPTYVDYDSISYPIGWPRWGRTQEIRDWYWENTSPGAPLSEPVKFTKDEGCEHACGWPMLAGWYEILGKPIMVIGGMSFPNPSGFVSLPQIRALPYTPIWAGLAIDSVFWGAAAFGLVAGPRAMRRAIRRRRALCPACAYPVGASPVCTECGAAVTPIVSSTPVEVMRRE